MDSHLKPGNKLAMLVDIFARTHTQGGSASFSKALQLQLELFLGKLLPVRIDIYNMFIFLIGQSHVL